MKTKNFYLLLSFLFFLSCSEKNTPPIFEDPEISTINVQDIQAHSVLVTGKCLKFGDYDIIDHGFVLAKNSEPTLNDLKFTMGLVESVGEFQSIIDNLESNTEYFIRSYIEYDIDKVMYGNTLSFSTIEVNVWTQKFDFSDEYLTRGVSFVVDEKLFVGTGVHDTYENYFYEFDYTNNSWKPISDLPSDPRSDGISFAVGGFGYVGLGKTCIGSGICTHYYFKDLWRYDPQNDNWTKMSDFPGTPRAFSTCFVIDDKAYVTGGSAVDNDLWEYDTTTDTWTKKTDYPGGCTSRGLSFSINNKGYVGFGWKDGTCNDFWEYDPQTDQWSQKENFPGAPRYSAVGFSYMSVGYIACGVNQDYGNIEYLTDLWQYMSESDTWIKINTDYPGNGRVNMVSAVVDSRIFIGLGSNSTTDGPENRFGDIWEYVPDYK